MRCGQLSYSRNEDEGCFGVGEDFILSIGGGLKCEGGWPGVGSDYKETCYLAHTSIHSFNRVQKHRTQLNSY